MKASSEGKPLCSESAQNVNTLSKTFWHSFSCLFFILGTVCHFCDTFYETVALLPSLTHSWCELSVILSCIDVETTVPQESFMELFQTCDLTSGEQDLTENKTI